MRALISFLRSVAAFGLGPLVALITAPLLAQALGPAGRGQLAAILQPLTVADAVSAFGIPATVAYFIARGNNPVSVERLGYLGIAVTGALTYLMMIIYSAPVASKQGLPQIALIAIWSASLIGAVIAVRRGRWSGTQSWRRLDLERAGSALARLAGILVLAFAGATSAVLFAVTPLVTGVLVSSVTLFTSSPPPTIANAAPATARYFYRYAGTISIGTIAFTMGSRIDQFLMPIYISSAELGIYVVAVTVAEVPLIVGMVLSRNLIPEIAAGKRPRMVATTYVSAILIAACAATAISVTSPWLVPVFFGSDFASAAPIIWLLAIAAVFSVSSAGASAMLSGLGSPLAAATGYGFPIISVIGYLWAAGAGTTLLGVAISVLIGQALCAATLIILLVLRYQMTNRA